MNTFPTRLAAAREAKGLNQSQLAKLLGVTPQAVQSWEAGKAVPRSFRLAEVARLLGVDYYTLAGMEPPRSFQVAEDFAERVRLGHPHAELPDRIQQAEISGTVEEWDDNTPLEDDVVALPFLKEVELSAGSGRTAIEVASNRRLRFGKYSLRGQNVQAENAVAVSVCGNSMEPVMPDGTTVAVNRADTRIVDGKTYALDHGGQLRVKLLYRLPGGGLRVRSHNRDEHPDEDYTEDQVVAQGLTILGRVFWVGMYL